MEGPNKMVEVLEVYSQFAWMKDIRVGARHICCDRGVTS
jgi:hypothetical protein